MALRTASLICNCENVVRLLCLLHGRGAHLAFEGRQWSGVLVLWERYLFYAGFDVRGYVAPCVCEACLQCAGRQALPNSNCGELAISILELARATVKAVAAISKVVSDMCSSILAHPFLSMSALILSGLMSVAISEQA